MTNLNYHCPICETKSGKILGQLKYMLFDDSNLPENINVVSCEKCGFVFNDRTFTQKDLNIISSKYLQNKNIFNDRVENKNKKLSHVLEHIVDLKTVLNSLSDIISKDDIIYIEVPDASRYDFLGNPLRMFYYTHINHFDIYSLKKLFESNGYEITDNGYNFYKENDLCIPSIYINVIKESNNTKINKLINNIKKFFIINKKPTFALANKINAWFDDEQYNNLDDNNILKDLVSNENKVIYIWGLGIHTNLILGMSPLKDYLYRMYFIDSNKEIQKREMTGKIIHDTDILYNATKDDVVIIGSPTHSKEMHEQLINKIGFKGQVIIIEFGNIRLE